MQWWLMCVCALSLAPARAQQVPEDMVTGIKIGEVASDRAVVWTRRSGSVDASRQGQLKLRWWPLDRSGPEGASDWTPVDEAGDGVHQFALTALMPATHYAVEVSTRADDESEVSSFTGAFATAPLPSTSSEARFVVVTGQSYPNRDAGDAGHRIYEPMRALAPDFFIHTGDVLYYDKPPEARDVPAARQRWHRMYSLPLQRSFHRSVPSFFLKDDHDTLKDDCWPGQTYGELTFARGVELFREQVPTGPSPYRRVRWGKHLELWLLEGREFRSPNNMPDGPDKTILGAEQLAWLARTLPASDASFRVVVSATPIVGPDRTRKADNHSNRAFAHEGARVRELIASVPGALVVCGDRHWQYTSVDGPTGLWEFSCGPTTDRHAGGFSENQRTEAHRYLAVRGGFLSVSVTLEERGPMLSLRHHDTRGRVLNEERFEVPPE